MKVAIIAPVSRFLVARLHRVFNRVASLRELIARFITAARDGRAGSEAQSPPAPSKFMSPPAEPDIASKFTGSRPRRLRPRFRTSSFTRIKPPTR